MKSCGFWGHHVMPCMHFWALQSKPRKIHALSCTSGCVHMITLVVCLLCVCAEVEVTLTPKKAPPAKSTRRSEIFHSLFPNKFSPFQFSFCQKLNTSTAFTSVTFRGEKTATPPQFPADQNSNGSPALWPPTPSRFPPVSGRTASSSSDQSVSSTATYTKEDRRPESPSCSTESPTRVSCSSAEDEPPLCAVTCSATKRTRRSLRATRRSLIPRITPLTQPEPSTSEESSAKCQETSERERKIEAVKPFRQTMSDKEAALNSLCEIWSPLAEESRPSNMSDEGEMISVEENGIWIWWYGHECNRNEENEFVIFLMAGVEGKSIWDKIPARFIEYSWPISLSYPRVGSTNWCLTVDVIFWLLPVAGRIRTAVGQARLLMRQRFAQFAGLCDGAEVSWAAIL